jgi:hypothetical protein
LTAIQNHINLHNHIRDSSDDSSSDNLSHPINPRKFLGVHQPLTSLNDTANPAVPNDIFLDDVTLMNLKDTNDLNNNTLLDSGDVDEFSAVASDDIDHLWNELSEESRYDDDGSLSIETSSSSEDKTTSGKSFDKSNQNQHHSFNQLTTS